MDHSHHHHQNTEAAPAKKQTAAISHTHHDMNPPMGQEGHNHHAMMINDFKKRFWISLILTVPILLLSEMIQHWLGFEIKFPGDKYVLLSLSSFTFFYGGWPFLKGFVDEIKSKSPGMMTLIALAITVAYVFSVAIIFGFQGMDFFWELATLIVIMLLGHWVEMKSVMGASKALELLVSMMPSEAHVIRNGQTLNIPISELQREDLIQIKPGEKVPADGLVEEGKSYLNES